MVLLFAVLAWPAAAANHIRASLVAESATPAAGQAVTLAILMEPDKGWHGYWLNPGDAGQAARFDWTLPKGVTVSEPRYPVPEQLLIAGLMNHVFNGEHALLVRVEVPAGLAAGTRLPFRVKGEWLACTDRICVPERGEMALDLVVGAGKPDARARFDAWRAKLPRPLGSPATFAAEGKTLRIAIPYPAAAAIGDAWFYAATQDAVAYAAPQKVARDGDRLIVETQLSGAPPPRLEGVLAIGDGKGLDVAATPGPVPAGGPDWDFATILVALGGAILGGLLLNIMPCVFPIISLKALSLAKAGGDERAAKRDALAYTAGVVLTCLALGGVLLGLRAAGQSIGWAFQLQNPWILGVLFVLAVAITLNLLGLFELRGFGGGETLAGKGGAAGSFWTGALAAFVATPCTGPFMAAALGAALVLPTAAALAIFAGLGLGLAIPFLLIGFVPAIRTRMPKPGAWMATFRRWLALPMALTAAALAWLLWPHITGESRDRGEMVARLEVSFSEDLLNEHRAKGQPVFLYFTADWCLTCKVNEKAAIQRSEVRDAFEKAGVVVMVGDWTDGDPAITRFLESRGRSGVPLYLWYAKGGEPRELPQVLTPGTLTALTE